MVHHDLKVLLLRKVDQFLSLRGIAGERLFYEHVLAIFQGRLCQFEVCPDRGNDCNGVDLG